MAQLVKLRDYISRYEWNIYRYPTQYIRLKQENWGKMKQSWDSAPQGKETYEPVQKPKSRLLKWFRFRSKQVPEDTQDKHSNIPQTELELKHLFLDELLSFQLKWATSTISDVSFIDPSIYNDEHLIYFLQRLPDTCLLLYYPVFHLKKAPVDADIILISPTEIEIIHLIEKDEAAMIRTREGRTWDIEINGTQSTLLNPEISLKRTESIVKSVLSEYGVEMPVKRTVLSIKNSIVTDHYIYQTNILDRYNHQHWLQQKRNPASPLKNIQLKTAGLLLKHCLTSSVKRPEWEEENNEFTMGYGD